MSQWAYVREVACLSGTTVVGMSTVPEVVVFRYEAELDPAVRSRNICLRIITLESFVVVLSSRSGLSN